ncbi:MULTISPECIES: RNA polymerase sigma factor [Petrimonas]|jgi:RNA polymerase sigma-70 factor (ECF subfamily)|uniref:ECF RNA polymerase sigma-E factor n=1 Tax=Petrimonas mucosa TaxID=1642646 RepID=A0A1G4G5Q3_9BACT|nr:MULTISPECIES: RNA polymerase sigma factor [Petrimonas]MDD3560307.1 RNA polymerase sigma factor [Petrimonas mucosa]SCM56747.1 ECF RNA polymerase sigma-E factor [Petrimonas mucosa]SFU37858.1 RNA polymerase sigma-70 factor, ECF subfamily [Porphyromonadaceae bacterium KHP3R9]HHT29482.1 RNA polymerase sigma factor [Petrimonas mucosa]
MDDSQLIAACKKQNRSAQKALYELYAPKMMAVCMRYCKDNETARDLLHDGFLQVFTQIGSYAGKGSFEGWLRRIFVNLALENYRKEKKRLDFLNDYGKENEDFLDAPEDDCLEVGDVPRQELLDIIRGMPEGYRTVFNMVVFEDMPHKEIAAMLGITENASRSQYFRAKTFLQNKVQSIMKKKYI